MRASQKWICAAVVGVLICLFSLPFLFLREQIKQLATLGYIGLFLACFISNASVLLPSSSTMYVVLAATALNPIWCVAFGGLGAALESCALFCAVVLGLCFGDRRAVFFKEESIVGCRKMLL